LNLLSAHDMCVMATCGPDGPLATPVRYFHLDFAVMFTAMASSPKMRNIAADPRVSIAIFAPLVGQASSHGAQVFGRARVLMPSDREYGHYWPAYRWQPDYVERSRSLDKPPTDTLVVVKADRIVYTEHWLRRTATRPANSGGVRLKSTRAVIARLARSADDASAFR
jgi:hypothetical protein